MFGQFGSYLINITILINNATPNLNIKCEIWSRNLGDSSGRIPLLVKILHTHDNLAAAYASTTTAVYA